MTEIIFPKRVKKFREELLKGLPKFPNNRETINSLEKQGNSSVFLHYITWVMRFVPDRKRVVFIAPEVKNDSRWKSLQSNILSFAQEVKEGNDLTAYLSKKIFKKGYTPKSAEIGKNINRWVDKDFLLMAMGYHHFHIGKRKEDRSVKRSNEVLFVRVTRSEFHILGIFNHSVFDVLEKGKYLNSERERLWEIFEKPSKDFKENTVYIQSLIATSSHPMHIVNLASKFGRLIAEIEPKLDDLDFLVELYDKTGITPTMKTKLKWSFHFSDLGLFDKKAGIFICLQKGLDL